MTNDTSKNIFDGRIMLRWSSSSSTEYLKKDTGNDYFQKMTKCFPCWSLAANNVLYIRQATVQGPTPPGTGVTNAAT